jgi:multidrug efflux pump subunit AcrB
VKDVEKRLGLAGIIARLFINSKLTPLIILSCILLGVMAVILLPREEEPQIIVPMIDVFVSMPGSSAREVGERVSKPLEKLLWEVPGVEYIYSTSSPGRSLVIVRFRVGEDEEKAIVRLNQKMWSNFDIIPTGASGPLVKPRSIDDVPILALTLSGRNYDEYSLRRIAAQLQGEIKAVPDVSEVKLIGGQRRQLRVILDPAAMAAHNVSPLQIERMLQSANQRLPAGTFSENDRERVVEVGEFLKSAEDAGKVVVGVYGGKPVYLFQVARIVDGGEEPDNHVMIGHGRSASASINLFEGETHLMETKSDLASSLEAPGSVLPAVTISVAKRKGTNAALISTQVKEKVSGLKGILIPGDLNITVTRDYGETATDKSNELLWHMLIAVVSVSLLIFFSLGKREALIVATAIPVTLALTLLIFYLYGFTLNRITLFALIFSIGILVDDAIVVVENITRHCSMPANANRPLFDVAVEAVNEVGNPTILATFAVIAAILPMAFVGGLMGPYMRPIPVGASSAMMFSLLVAFIVTPWASVRLLKIQKSSSDSQSAHDHDDWSSRLYRKLMSPLIRKPFWRLVFLLTVTGLLAAALSLFAFKLVVVKMLPFDNKNELQIIVDMPEGSTLERTTAVCREIGAYIAGVPEITDYEIYSGTSSPYNFNGLVRHYFSRMSPNQADIQVNFLGRDKRTRQSHEIARSIRPPIFAIASRYGARIKIAEVPPGPPVLETIVTEVYGPDYSEQIKLAGQIKEIFEKTPGLVDVDWYVEDDQTKYSFAVDRTKAALNGVSCEEVARTLKLSEAGESIGLAHNASEQEDMPVLLRLRQANRSNINDLLQLRVQGKDGNLVPISELVSVRQELTDKSIFHKNLMPVVYVTADLAGREESPVYAIFKLQESISKIPMPAGYKLEQYTATLPGSTRQLSIKWDGEWHITYEVFRDMGLAFAAVLVLIYILVVGWFQSFTVPFVIMAAIPFSLVGILPAHWLMGAFFTATSMIGFIAGAGIVVRNSIILIDFVELRLKEGMPLDEAVIDAGAVRFRPMMLTAAAVVVGASVILFDPIFQGLALSLMAGELASLLLSRMTIPILYYIISSHRHP